MSFKSIKMRKIISMFLVVVVLLTSIQAPQAQAGYKSNNDNSMPVLQSQILVIQ